MKLTITQENLSRGLNIVSRISNSPTTEILNTILLRAENGQLELNTTNLDVFITHSTTAKIEEDGVVCIPANLITDFVTNLPKINIKIEVTDNKLKITAGEIKSTINTINPEDFPTTPVSKFTNSLKIYSDKFKNSTNQVINVTSSDSTRPILTGLYMHTNKNNLYFVATDGYRLAEKNVQEEKSEISVIIPSSTISEINRLIDKLEDDIEIELNDEQIKFTINETVLISRLIDGKYISYESLIPSSTENQASQDKTEFVQTIKQADLFAREAADLITIKTNQEKQLLEIYSITTEKGDYKNKINSTVSGDGTITLNAKYLLQALSCIEGETVNFNFSGKLAPILLTGKNDNYKHIIMPVKS
ncbi:DNA polymerase III subunit beta [Ruminococcaceae bacterium OttesenSCG-928-A11]|nr:DNA polymerase III subunit beta [Ruminococcaceae bacterium OttesenSCG-928-A11]